jgi:hypothetical protein
MPSCHQPSLAACGIDLGQRRRTLLRAPNAPSIWRGENVCFGQHHLLLGPRRNLQRSARSPAIISVAIVLIPRTIFPRVPISFGYTNLPIAGRGSLGQKRPRR